MKSNECAAMSKKLVIIGIAVLLIVVALSGCVEEPGPKDGDKRVISTEYTGGDYNASILYEEVYEDGKWSNCTEIRYTKNGREYIDYFKLSMRDALDWIKSNTNENATILCWWDYGGMIIGYCERNAIARFASLALKDTLHPFAAGWFDEERKNKFIEENEWASNETIEDIANILTTTNFTSNETKQIIEKYNTNYILTDRYDFFIAKVFFATVSKNADEYIIDKMPTEKGNETLIFKMWDYSPEISGLKMVYENYPWEQFSSNDYDNIRIFEIVTS